MTTPSPRRAAGFLLRCIALFSLLLAASAPSSQLARAQDPRRDDDDEVLRVSTNLVQTDVTVLDKQGRPVTDLRPEQFELKVDGQTQPLLFFERVTAGSAGEASALRRSTRGATPTVSTTAASASATRPAPPRGRSVIFFIDDLHLSSEGVARARDILLSYIERRLAPGTPTLIASTSGQIGFLQQFTDDRAVLRAAARRVRYQSTAILDFDQPPMSERIALEIDRGNRGALDYYVVSWIRDNPSRSPTRRDTAEQVVRGRARTIVERAAQVSEATISSLESAVGARGPEPGRRILFFVSEGFTLTNRKRDIGDKYRRVIAAAARAGTVVYTLDARGLAVPMLDASSGMRADIELETDLTVVSPSADMAAQQEVLRGLAADTGGRALLNTNGLEQAVESALGETAEYYVLAWRPEAAETAGRSPQFRRVEVSVRGRPDLTVRVRSGFLDARADDARQRVASGAAGSATPAVRSSNATLSAVIAEAAERRALPVELYAIFNGETGSPPSLTALVQLTDEPVRFAPAGEKLQAEVTVACVVLDDTGKTVFSEGRTLTLTRAAPGGGASRVITQFPAQLTKPGLYQVRVAAHDARGGLTGSAFQWVEVPDLKAGRLALSTPVIVERHTVTATTAPETPQAVSLNVDRRFARASRLRAELYVYNAARAAGGANVEMEIKVWRDGRVALSAPPHKLADAGAADPSRIRYDAEVPLRGLAPGPYILEVSAADRTTRAAATRQIAFTVE
ncbi:MAG TPA: VWA domain-containing protein [Pyrinomonadaceae bacterium]